MSMKSGRNWINSEEEDFLLKLALRCDDPFMDERKKIPFQEEGWFEKIMQKDESVDMGKIWKRTISTEFTTKE